MNELKIRTEYLPERCEVCHQADRFDARANYCARCHGVTDILALHATALQLHQRLVNMRGLLGPEMASTGRIVTEDALSEDDSLTPDWLALPVKVFLLFLKFSLILSAVVGLIFTQSILGMVIIAFYGMIFGVFGGLFCASIISVIMLLAKFIKWTKN